VIPSLIAKNIARSKKNSLLIILLIASITFLFFIGNSIINRSDRGLKEAYIDSFTGEVVIQKAANVTMNLFGANTPIIENYFTIPELPACEAVMEIVRAEAGAGRVTSQVSTRACMDVPGNREAVLLLGADPATYFDAFPGIVPVEGALLRPGEYGALITVERAERIAALTGKKPEIGMPLLFTAAGGSGFKIREAPLKGIYRYRNPGPFMNEIVITDPQTARILASIQVASGETDAGAAADAGGFLDTDLDDLFGAPGYGADTAQDEALTPDFLAGFLDSFPDDASEPLSGGAWHFIILRLQPGFSAGEVVASLNEKLIPLGAVAVGWRIAAGFSAILLLFIQTLFNAGILLVSIAGVIAAVNILLISVFKRTRELGTLRAIGAGDGYIRSLVLGENLALAGVAGALSVLAGAGLIAAVNKAGVVISNGLIASLLGGPVLSLSFIPSIAVLSCALALALGFAASLYPVEAAVRIDPIIAVRQG
jgi:ABC-type lipoprotein release transport system permease subunit